MISILASVAVSAALVLGGMWLHIDTFNELSTAVKNLSAQEQKFGLAVFDETQGGTGTSTVSANFVGDCLSVTDDSPLTYSWATCSSSGSGDPYPFQGANNSTTTLVRLYGGASTTRLSAHQAWFGATATSTFGTDGALTLASALAVTSGGTGATTLDDIVGTANQITITNGADTIIGGDATLSLPSHVIFPTGYQASIGSTTNATSTNLTVTGNTILEAMTSALLLTGATGLVAEYTGTSCTNQFVRSLSALGASTCATVGAADVSLANLTATDSTLTFSGTYNGSTARTIGLNLGNANTWTATQTFANATSSNATSSLSFYVGTHQVPNFGEVSWAYSSSTQGSGTTTKSLYKVMTRAGSYTTAQCNFSNFMRVLAYDVSGNRMNDFIASSTVGTVTLSTNNSFTAGEAILFDVGTTTNIGSLVEGGCSFKYTNN